MLLCKRKYIFVFKSCLLFIHTTAIAAEMEGKYVSLDGIKIEKCLRSQ